MYSMLANEHQTYTHAKNQAEHILPPAGHHHLQANCSEANAKFPLIYLKRPAGSERAAETSRCLLATIINGDKVPHLLDKNLGCIMRYPVGRILNTHKTGVGDLARQPFAVTDRLPRIVNAPQTQGR